jgi:7-cyano-7-deazaguanine synthase
MLLCRANYLTKSETGLYLTTKRATVYALPRIKVSWTGRDGAISYLLDNPPKKTSWVLCSLGPFVSYQYYFETFYKIPNLAFFPRPEYTALMNKQQKKAVVLLSGGLDSATTLAVAKNQGYALYALTFQYGQRHHFEIEAARRVALHFQAIQHKIVNVDLATFGGSALTAEIDVPKDRPLDQIPMEIPITYVPARNTIFLSLALAWAEVLRARDIFIGVNALDYSGYPDCRPEFIRAFEQTANLGTKAGVEGNCFHIHTPLINLNKAQIIQKGLTLGVDFSQTSTCYDPSLDGRACGKCDACLLRLKGFAEAGIKDPVLY